MTPTLTRSQLRKPKRINKKRNKKTRKRQNKKRKKIKRKVRVSLNKRRLLWRPAFQRHLQNPWLKYLRSRASTCLCTNRRSIILRSVWLVRSSAISRKLTLLPPHLPSLTHARLHALLTRFIRSFLRNQGSPTKSEHK